VQGIYVRKRRISNHSNIQMMYTNFLQSCYPLRLWLEIITTVA